MNIMKIKIIKFLKTYLKNDKKLLISSITFLIISSLITSTFGMLVGFSSEKLVEGLYKESIVILCAYLILCSIDILIFARINKIQLNNLVNNLTEKIQKSILI